MLVTLPKKEGKKYLHRDENGKVDYGFVVENNVIKQFLRYTKTPPKQIVLPVISNGEPAKYYGPVLALKLANHEQQKYALETLFYLSGEVTIAKRCFAGLKELDIVKPDETSVKFERCCFDRDASVTIHVSEKMNIKRVFNKAQEYLLCAHNACDGITDIDGDKYFVCNYDETYSGKLFLAENVEIKNNLANPNAIVFEERE